VISKTDDKKRASKEKKFKNTAGVTNTIISKTYEMMRLNGVTAIASRVSEMLLREDHTLYIFLK